MLKILARKIKRTLFRTDYERMVSVASRGGYEEAALIALTLGENELFEQYRQQARSLLIVRHSSSIIFNPYRRLALEYELKTKRQN